MTTATAGEPKNKRKMNLLTKSHPGTGALVDLNSIIGVSGTPSQTPRFVDIIIPPSTQLTLKTKALTGWNISGDSIVIDNGSGTVPIIYTLQFWTESENGTFAADRNNYSAMQVSTTIGRTLYFNVYW